MPTKKHVPRLVSEDPSAKGFLLIVTITFAYVTPWLTGKLTYVVMFQHTVECTGQQILS
jgi:hypothetical protein